MSVPSNLLQTAEADSLLGQSHYLRAIASMAKDESLVLRDAIYTANGVRLAEKGMLLDSAFYDSLVNERLRHPIDELVDVRRLVDVPTLEAECMTLCESAMLPRMLMRALGDAEQWRLLAPLADMANALGDEHWAMQIFSALVGVGLMMLLALWLDWNKRLTRPVPVPAA